VKIRKIRVIRVLLKIIQKKLDFALKIVVLLQYQNNIKINNKNGKRS
jgi:hypothetical protein